MTKLTEMSATARRLVARKHRVDANLISLQMDKLVGFSPRYAKLKTKHLFHLTQAKLWDTAAAQAEAVGLVRV